MDFYRQRGGGERFEARLKSPNFEVADFDFDAELWNFWKKRAQTDEDTWVDLVQALADEIIFGRLQAVGRRFDFAIGNEAHVPSQP